MKQITGTIILSFICVSTLLAQGGAKDEKKYKERAAEVQEEIWSSGGKPFDVIEVPSEYKNESAVVLAKMLEVTNSSKKKLKISLFGPGFATRLKYYTTLRERVKINDKAALDEFSTLEYKKNLNNTSSIFITKIVETYKTYVGAKVIKTDGKQFIVNADEEVLTKNEAKDKEGKLAIPNLQVGDILDYYIRIEEVTENGADTRGPNVFPLGGEYPILYYNVKYTLDKKCGADVMSMNGAKPIAQSENDDNDIVLEFTEKNLPKAKTPMWSCFARQFPYHVIRYGFLGASIVASPGNVKRGPFTELYKTKLKNYYTDKIRFRLVDFSVEKPMEEYFGGKKAMKELPSDSIINYLYNYYHWSKYPSLTNMNVSNEKNNGNMDWYDMAITFSEVLRDYDIENDIVLVCNRFSGRLNEIFGLGDIETFVKINHEGKYKWIAFNDFFHNTGQLPSAYQGENALVITREGRDRKPKFSDTELPIKLPVSKSTENVIAETIKVEFGKENMQLLTIDRSVTESGEMKQSDQKKLLTAQEVNDGFAALIGKMSAVEYLLDDKKTKAKAAELQTAIDKEKINQKDYFKDEINAQYDQYPKELISYQIVNNGFAVQKPVFEFKQKFTMENFVKKAGNNYILDAGKLMGTFSKVEEKDRTRTVDIYMSAARTLSYTFDITIPEGYTVKGLDEINKKTENDVASFTSTAKQSGNIVTITASRTYNSNYEPVSNWSKLLQVMDAASEFTEKKLLLEKKK
ncbi:hypothetical protein ACQ33O_01360 [Ferruginibacter sp. SUN002]|uniref:hypothetical protein n=1 Tax=Ferruginibacter sp. SUN002 TaxID=2937789 RepID=UPI003D36DDF8